MHLNIKHFCCAFLQDFLQEMVDKDEKIKSLQEMGFPKDDVDRAINICGNLSLQFVDLIML
jgi:uncharacterized UBP type Zn finger protein